MFIQSLRSTVRPLARKACLLALCCTLPASALAQSPEDELGGWYVYAFTKNFADSRFGVQGDIQQRNFELGSDLNQLLVRAGLMWTPEGSSTRYTAGYVHLTSGTFGPSGATSDIHQLYQEALTPQRVGEKLFLTHRWRLEQRWIAGQDQRNRLRYFLGANYPLNQATLGKGSIYVAGFFEYFLNLERDIGGGRKVDYFDHNRTFAGLGYSVSDRTRLQAGYLHRETPDQSIGQLMFMMIQSF
jgi:hypothetical protein